MILAMGKNRVIGKDNKMPWHLPAELAYFRKVTMGHVVLMGRNTYESIGKPLKGRTNVIMTRNRTYRPSCLASGQCVVVHGLQEALEYSRDQEVFVIGGAEIYRQALPYANKLYITLIDHEFEGDTFFPEVDEHEWKLMTKEPGVTDENNPYTYYYQVFERIQSE